MSNLSLKLLRYCHFHDKHLLNILRLNLLNHHLLASCVQLNDGKRECFHLESQVREGQVGKGQSLDHGERQERA